MTETQTTPDIDHATALRQLAAMTETLPAPLAIRFARKFPDMLYVELDSAQAVTAWGTALQVNDWSSRGERYTDTVQWRVHGNWHGYYLSVEAILTIEKPACDCDCSKAGA